jgi:hypothetical protein
VLLKKGISRQVLLLGRKFRQALLKGRIYRQGLL